jgi:ArsR family transcriptional regulator
MDPAALLRAFADPTRMRILRVLGQGETCVGDLVTILGVTQPRASRHLGRLRRAGLVTVRKDGRWAHYSLATARSAFHRRLLGCLACCEEPQLARDGARARTLRRAGGCCPPATAPGEFLKKPLRRPEAERGGVRRGRPTSRISGAIRRGGLTKHHAAAAGRSQQGFVHKL